MFAPSSNRRAFTLVEVALALGIVAFALVPIIGILGIAMTTNTESGSDTSIAAMTTLVLNDLRSAPFNAMGEAVPSDPANYQIASLNTTLADSTYYFSNEGSLVYVGDPTKMAASTASQVVYECWVRKTADTSTQTPNADPTKPGTYNQIRLQLLFSWPYLISDRTKRTNQRSIYASVARY